MRLSSRSSAFGMVCVLLVIVHLLTAGCTSPGGTPPSGQEVKGGKSTSFATAGVMPQATGPGGCTGPAECTAFCEAHHDVCDQFCAANPDACTQAMGKPAEITPGGAGAGGPLRGTACDNTVLKQKMKAVIDSALEQPPETIRYLNWMTKILPAANPYPGYYYTLSIAFGPAIDEAGTDWSGAGEPVMAKGKDHYSFGFWDERPKGMGGRLGEETPESVDFSRYQLAVFYANVSGSNQDAMIRVLPDLTMSESEARAFFYRIFKKSFINLDNRELVRSGPKLYEATWHDTDETQSYWDVQIGTGYIAIGQGRVYTEESQLKRDPGTVWRYHSCKPCESCLDWTQPQSLNRDCIKDTDCLSGLSCSGGYCMAPGAGRTQAQTRKEGGGAPGSPCAADCDCGAGLSCRNSVCTIPQGGG